jgi:hypothetical protein
MREQRIDTGGEAATGTSADPGEGLGTATPGAHTDPLDPLAQRQSGSEADMAQPRADSPAAPGADADADADTEGARYLQETQGTAAAQQRSEPDLGGRQPAGEGPLGDDAARPSLASGSAGDATAETGEVSAAPSPERRAEDPGSVATEFGDRAGTAPEDDIARPTI